MQLASVGSGEQNRADASIGIAHQQPRRNAAGDASCGAGAMYFTAARLHNTEVAFRVDNLARERDGLRLSRERGRDIHSHADGLGAGKLLQAFGSARTEFRVPSTRTA